MKIYRSRPEGFPLPPYAYQGPSGPSSFGTSKREMKCRLLVSLREPEVRTNRVVSDQYSLSASMGEQDNWLLVPSLY